MIRHRDALPRQLAATAVAVARRCCSRRPAHAAGSRMPWEAPLQPILESIEGPVAKIIAVIIIIVTGLTLAFGETSGGFRRLIQIVFGLSIAFAASSFFLSFFSLRRRGAGLMERRADIAGLRRAGPPRADRADPARRRAARGRHRQRHARRARSASACGSGSPASLLWAIGHVAAVWAAQARSAVRRRRAPASALSRPI